MNARALIGLSCGLIVCAGVVGFVVGYSWPRNPVEDPATKQLLSLTEKMSSDVIGIQHALARDATCPNESLATSEAKEGANPNTIKKSAAATRDDTAQQRSQVEALVTRGIAAGRWTDNDVQELRVAMRGLPGEEMEPLLTPLLQAINSQQVKLEAASGVL
jgi:hypothetical protein